jgi:hypothetical protein
VRNPDGVDFDALALQGAQVGDDRLWHREATLIPIQGIDLETGER